MIGETVSHYRILNELGRGGMGIVYAAEDTRLRRKVALKFLPEDVAGDGPALERFRREAQAASALNHPGICTIYDVGEDAGRPFIAMELLEGRTLRERIAEGPIEFSELMRLAIALANAVDAAHGQGIIHRDLKPANIYVTDRGDPKILDFGLAKLERRTTTEPPQPLATTEEFPPDSLTSPGAAVGTVAYMSPEQARGESLDSRTDLFSLGVVLYEMATGMRPFRGKTTAIIFDAILHATPVRPTEVNSQLPPALDQMTQKALDKDCNARYQTASDLRADLLRIQRDLDSGKADGVEHTTVTTPPAETRSKRFLPALAVSGIALSAVLALGFYSGWFRQPQPEPRSDNPSKPVAKARTPVEVQLTASPDGSDLDSGSLSPKGTYIAYSNPAGELFLRAIESGRTTQLNLPDELKVNQIHWYPDETKLLITTRPKENDRAGQLWSLSLPVGTPRKIYDDVYEAAVSPDGSQIAFRKTAFANEIWIMGARGESPRTLIEGKGNDILVDLNWSSNGAHLFYCRVCHVTGSVRSTACAIEARSLNDGISHVVVKEETKLFVRACGPSLACLPRGFVVYPTQESPKTCTLWIQKTDLTTAKPIGKPVRIMEWSGVFCGVGNATTDGQQLYISKMLTQRDVYIADFESQHRKLKNIRRLTLDDRDDQPTCWTRDSRSILFSSNRRGTWDIFRQPVDRSNAEAVVAGPLDEFDGTLSADGAHIYYRAARSGKNSRARAPSQWIRLPLSGGPSNPVMRLSPQSRVRFYQNGRGRSILSEPTQAGTTFFEVDPKTGRKLFKIAHIKTRAVGGYEGWSISPDGKRIAVASGKSLKILDLKDKSERVLWSGDAAALQFCAWSHDGTGIFVTGFIRDTKYGIVFIDLTGKSQVLLEGTDTWYAYPVPSPNGRHLAFSAQGFHTNAWLLKDFLPDVE